METAVAPHPVMMKAIVQEGSGSADVLHLRKIERPAATEGRVLVKVRAASVNAADWHMVHGGAAVRVVRALMRAPFVPIRGGDMAGVVEAVGPDVTRLKPGDQVFGGGRGAFAEYATSAERTLALKPPAVSFEQAATIGIAGCTALQGLRDTGGVRAGQRVLVNGAGGGVGTYAVQIARSLGAHVTAVTSTRNLDVVRALGADEVIDYEREDFTRRTAVYDVIFDVAANRPLRECARVLLHTGTLVLAGAAKGGSLAIVARLANARLLSRTTDKRFSSFLARVSHDDLVVLAGLVATGTVSPVIDRTYPLSEAVEAIRYLGTGQARAKVVITVA